MPAHHRDAVTLDFSGGWLYLLLVERAVVVEYVRGMDRDALLQLLIDVEHFQGDDLALALANALRAKDAPVIALRAAKDAVTAWARGDAKKLLYADEVDDILLRVAGDIGASGA